MEEEMRGEVMDFQERLTLCRSSSSSTAIWVGK